MPEPPAPPVVAVVVASDPGSWFEESLSAFGAQDYPNLSVLVIDAGRDDVTARVAGILPTAYVRRLDRPRPFGVAANEVIGVVEGASHYVVCHDDVAPDPSAVRLLMEEALRSNAGLVSPKLVAWDDPRRLLAVGAGADRVGDVQPLVEAGELDQQQHDTPRDVFVAPGGAVLVRADLFEVLGGFDPLVADHGEDLDLCWRAQVAGARVVVAPDARVRHLQATASGRRRRRGPADAADVHRLRTLLTCASGTSLLWLLPLALLYLLVDAVVAAASGHPGEAATRLAAPGRALRRPGELRRARRRVQRQRNAPDRQLRRLQSGGSARLRAHLRRWGDRAAAGGPVAASVAIDDPDAWLGAAAAETQRGRRDAPAIGDRAGRRRVRLPAVAGPAHVGDGDGEASPGAARASGVTTAPGSWRLTALAVVVLVIVLLIGSRSLLGHELPAIGTIPDTSAGIGSWWRAWLSTWQPAGLGSVGASPPALGLLTVAGALFLGAVGTLQHVLVLGALLVGPLGAYRLARPWGGRRGRVVALVAYAATPLAYDALAGGDWSALVAYAAAPWVLGALGRLSGDRPHPGAPVRAVAGRILGLGLLVALVGAVTPSFVLVVAVTAAAVAVGAVLAGQLPAAPRLLAVGVAAAAVGFVLLLPWSAAVYSD
ncbi:MAG TPA: glycosyltransferase, partial [Acidimicrobiales bacterium]|nr:glycosyltransferase [Acidimicrobiales bacterium]